VRRLSPVFIYACTTRGGRKRKIIQEKSGYPSSGRSRKWKRGGEKLRSRRRGGVIMFVVKLNLFSYRITKNRRGKREEESSRKIGEPRSFPYFYGGEKEGRERGRKKKG